MPDHTLNAVYYIGSFVAIWLGTGLIVSSIIKLSHRLRLPAFIISFFLLGILTSTPEIAVGLSSVANNTPSIFVGNLLGGILILFLAVIPMLAIIGRGIKINESLTQKDILISLLVSIAPFFVVLDQKVTNPEGLALIVIYCVGVFILQKDHKLEKRSLDIIKLKKYSLLDMLKVLLGTGVVFISSNIIVRETLYFSQIFKVAPFYISLILLSIGTNLPEITLAIRSILVGKKDIAFGDYLGSASANTFLFGIFILMTKDPVLQVDNFLGMFIVTAIGLFLFFHFTRTKHTVSAREGFVLLMVYATFLLIELTPR